MALGKKDKQAILMEAFARIGRRRQEEIRALAERYYEDYVKGDLEDGGAIQTTPEGECYARLLAPLASFFHGENDLRRAFMGESEYKETLEKEKDRHDWEAGFLDKWYEAERVFDPMGQVEDMKPIYDYWAPLLLGTGLKVEGHPGGEDDTEDGKLSRERARLEEAVKKAESSLETAKIVLLVSIVFCPLLPYGIYRWYKSDKETKEARADLQACSTPSFGGSLNPNQYREKRKALIKVEACDALSDLMDAFQEIGSREGLAFELRWAYAPFVDGIDAIEEGLAYSDHPISGKASGKTSHPTEQYARLAVEPYRSIRYSSKDLHPIGKEEEVLMLKDDVTRIATLEECRRVHPVFLVREKK